MSLSQATVLNSNTTILTIASGQRAEVRSCLFSNFSASTEVLTVYLVPQGSSAGNSTTILKSATILTLQTLEITYTTPLLLNAGDSVIAIGTTGSLVAATINYAQGNP